MMNPGRLSKRIKILKFADVSDGAGGYLDNWETEEGWTEVATVWADVKPMTAKEREFEEAQQQQAEITHKVTIRYNPKIKRGMTIKYGGRRLDIASMINIDEKSVYMLLKCIEGI